MLSDGLQDAVSWTTMIGGYAMLGCGKEALELFERMTSSGMSQVMSLWFVFCQHAAIQV